MHAPIGPTVPPSTTTANYQPPISREDHQIMYTSSVPTPSAMTPSTMTSRTTTSPTTTDAAPSVAASLYKTTYQMVLCVAAVVTLASLNVRTSAQRRIDAARADAERGEVSSTTIMVAVLVLLAVAVGAIITERITAKAETIQP